MSIRRQAYEWRNIVPGSTAVVSNSGHPVLNYNVATGNVDGRVIQIPDLVPYDIMVGGIGNNLEEPAMLRAHQLIVVDHMGSYPFSAQVLTFVLAQLVISRTPMVFLTSECLLPLCLFNQLLLPKDLKN